MINTGSDQVPMEHKELAAVIVDRLHQAFVEETKVKLHLTDKLRERLTIRMTEFLQERNIWAEETIQHHRVM